MEPTSTDERPVRTVRVGGRGRGPSALALLAVVGMALAILKPWQGPERSLIAGGAVPSPIALERQSLVRPPAAGLSPADIAARAIRDRRQCQSGLGWRVVTMEETGGRPTRTLLLIAPIPRASSPTDARIPTAVLYAQRLFAIGFCQPSGDGTTAAWPVPRVSLWSLTPPGRAAPVVAPVTLDPALAAAGESYFGPPAGSPMDEWPPARYVFRVQPPDARAAPIWFALEYDTTARAAAAGTSASH